MYDITVRTITGEDVSMERYRGTVLLIVNVASRCGFTSQYAGLEALYRSYHRRGFEILAFPCNQFAGQEPGSEDEIRTFCSTQYDITFPLFAKIEVNGDRAHLLFTHLKQRCRGVLGTESIKWNFTKFLVSRSGEVTSRFASTATPESLAGKVEELL